MLRIGVVGIGNMGRVHAQYLAAGEIGGATLAAVCDVSPAALEWARTHLGDKILRFLPWMSSCKVAASMG